MSSAPRLFLRLAVRRFSSTSLLRTTRIQMRKRLGQHLLTSPDTVAAIVAHASIAPGETVFEIGPGTGNLTVHLLGSPAAAVLAVELDERLARALEARVKLLPDALSSKFVLARGDFLRVPLPRFDALVANIPYQISSPVLARVLTASPPPRTAVLMFQKEFAERLVAAPSSADYSRLSVNTALLADAELVMRIGRAQFRPPPKVDSAVVRFRIKPPPAGLDFADWNAFLRTAFAGKNKTMRALLGASKTTLAKLSALREGEAGKCAVDTRADVLAVLDAVGASGWRANAIPLADFLRLYAALRAAGFRFVTDVERAAGLGDEIGGGALAQAWEADGAESRADDDRVGEEGGANNAPLTEPETKRAARRAARGPPTLPLLVPGSRRERGVFVDDDAPRASRPASWFAGLASAQSEQEVAVPTPARAESVPPRSAQDMRAARAAAVKAKMVALSVAVRELREREIASH